MRTITFLIIIFLFSVLLAGEKSTNSENVQHETDPGQKVTQSMINIGNLSCWIYHDGKSAVSPDVLSGVYYTDENLPLIFQDGLLWGGMVPSAEEWTKLRVGGQMYQAGTQPGWIETPGDSINPPLPVPPDTPQARIYRIRKDWREIEPDDPDIIRDAALLNQVSEDSVTTEMAEQVVAQYQTDFAEWPGDLVAPFYDTNQNGHWDPGTDIPGIANADQVIWLVVNDANELLTDRVFYTEPLGIELQITMWGYDSDDVELSDVIFKRYLLINKSGREIDSMFVAQWSDPDVIDFADDLAGCDSLYEIGYCYESDTGVNSPDVKKPAVGYQLLQGPIVPSDGNAAFFNFRIISGYKNLPLTSFGYSTPYFPEMDIFPEFNFAAILYNWLNGYLPDETLTPYKHRAGPYKHRITKFPLNGNPSTLVGDVDGVGDNFSPGDRKIILPSGPFTMQPGDSQEVVIALIGAMDLEQPGDRLLSLARLKSTAIYVRQNYFDLVTGDLVITETHEPEIPQRFSFPPNFPNPFNNSTRISFELAGEVFVNLSVYNTLGQEVRTLKRGKMPAGEYHLSWDGTNDAGKQLASGIYFLNMQINFKSKTHKMVLLR